MTGLDLLQHADRFVGAVRLAVELPGLEGAAGFLQQRRAALQIGTLRQALRGVLEAARGLVGLRGALGLCGGPVSAART